MEAILNIESMLSMIDLTPLTFVNPQYYVGDIAIEVVDTGVNVTLETEELRTAAIGMHFAVVEDTVHLREMHSAVRMLTAMKGILEDVQKNTNMGLGRGRQRQQYPC